MFPPLPYLEWIEGRPDAAEHDLGSSDLRGDARGDPDDPVPPRLAGLSPADDDVGLRELIAAEHDVAADRVLVAAGATHAGFLAAAAAVELARDRASGDSGGDRRTASKRTGSDATSERDDGPAPRALVEKPGYEPLVAAPGAHGARVTRFRRPLPEAELDPARVGAAASDLKGPLSHVAVTNRHNPTGRLVDRATLAGAAEAAAEEGGYLLVDEVYAPYTREAAVEGSAFGGPTAAGLPSAVTVGSLTKFQGLGGLRVGWITGPPEFVERARAVRRHLNAVADPSVALARRFFAHRDELVGEAREHCRTNYGLLAGFVDDRDDLSGTVDPGSPFAYVEHADVGGDAVADAAWEAGVLVVPGRFFGLDDGVRVSLGRSPDDCEAALDAFGAVLDGL